MVTMASTSDSTIYGDRSGGHSGCGGLEFVSQVVSRGIFRQRLVLLGIARVLIRRREGDGCVSGGEVAESDELPPGDDEGGTLPPKYQFA
jgi:hypothetical protein